MEGRLQDTSLRDSLEECFSVFPPILAYLIIRSVGLTVGRVALLWVNKSVGEKRVVFVYTLLCIG